MQLDAYELITNHAVHGTAWSTDHASIAAVPRVHMAV